MLAGTVDGESWGFYFDDQKEKLQKWFEISKNEHIELINGQAHGKVITFHDDRKPTLEDPPVPTEEEQKRTEAEQRIRELKAYLSETDYVAAKIAEGVATKEEYADVLEARAAARAEINELEEFLAE